METNKIKQRRQFMRDLATGDWSMVELCERYNVSRPTGYKWLRRFQEGGDQGLSDLPRVAETLSHRTPPDTVELILFIRRKRGWGAKKIIKVIERDFPDYNAPARSTVNAILDRAGMLKKRGRKRRWQHPGAMPVDTDHPNQVWPADFKGQFRLGNREYCFPLTVTDHYSRKILLCKALPSIRTEGARPAFEKLFREVGLPRAIRTDNGSPFASTGIHGLCELNVWWMQLGIVHQRIRPSSPQQNGQHERMHRDLKQETTFPPAGTLRGQQRKLDEFQRRYNSERPHEALEGEVPDTLWEPSPRPYPETLSPPEYPTSLEVRLVSNAGCFRLNNQDYFLTKALVKEHVGLEQVDTALWNVVYYSTIIGRLDERTGKLSGVGKL